MSNSLLKGQILIAHEKLTFISDNVNRFLNETTITSLNSEMLSEKEGYYESLLASLRRISVFSDEGKVNCEIIMNGNTFRKAAAEQTLYWVYHNCIEEFFNPRMDNWYEDSRSAYTGKNSIKFPYAVPDCIKELMLAIEGPFQTIREELEYYETDYRTKVIQTK